MVDFPLALLCLSATWMDPLMIPYVGSTQVPFQMCTLEIPQKIAAQVLALNFCYFALLLSFSLKLSLSLKL